MEPLPSAPDESIGRNLVERIRAGDPAAGDELYRRYHDEMLFAIRARLGAKLRGAMQSEDVLQSVALEAFRALPDFEHRGPGSLAAWLQRIVVNKIRDLADHWNAEKRDAGPVRGESALREAPGRAEPDASYSDPRYERLERALRGLPEDMRAVIVLRRVEGLSSREAAQRLGRSDDAVRQLHARAMARIALQLGHERGTT